MFLNKRKFGSFGEDKAIQYLQNNNYDIIERNFYCRQGEIDIIAKDNDKNEIVFIEVKTRNNFIFGKPVDAVDTFKQKHIWKSAKYYLYKYNMLNSFIRFDVIEIHTENNHIYIN